MEGDWAVAHTDGSSIEIDGVRKAGAGIFYGNGNGRNRAYAVGGKQTNQRAELTAFLRCVQNDRRKLIVRTDSKYVQLGVMQGIAKWKSKAWFDKPLKGKYIDNVDLWRRVDKTLKEREPESIRVEWVKGHALHRHISIGQTTERDIWGNGKADQAAGLAAQEIGGRKEDVYLVCKQLPPLE
jgi:ribonuclease HI